MVSEHDRLLYEYEALRAAITLKSLDRDDAVKRALVEQRAAHLEETRAWQHLTELREAHRADPSTLALVAAADQAEAAYEQARDTAFAVSRAATATAQHALAEAEADNDRLHSLGLRLRETRPAPGL